MGLNIEKEPGVGDNETQAASRPVNEPTPLTGPSMWAAEGNDRQAAFNLTGAYVHGEPGPQPTGPDPASHLAPTSDLTGHAPLPDAERLGRKGPVRLGQPASEARPAGNPPAVNNQ